MRELFLVCVGEWREGELKEMRGHLYPSPRKLPLGKGYPEISGICPKTLGKPSFLTESLIRRLRASRFGESGPIPGESGLGRIKSLVLLFWVIFVSHKCWSKFPWALDLNQNPWTKSLLIVRRSYTQISNIKSNLLSTLEHRLFIFFLRGHPSSLDSPVQTHNLHTCSNTQLNVHVFYH